MLCDSCNITLHPFFLDQQFITWSTKADCGSYIETTYMTNKLTWRYKNKKKEERKGKKIVQKEEICTKLVIRST